MKYHVQCALQRQEQHDVCWIPAKHAVMGKALRIKDEEGWRVTSVGTLPLPSKYIEERKNDYRTQRQASDI